jgi:hypothetical protein
MKLPEHNRVQLIWVPGQRVIEGNKTADQLARLGSKCPFIGPEPACSISAGIAKRMLGTGQTDIIKNTGALNRTQTGKGILTRTLCQKNQGNVKTKQKPVTIGDRTSYRILSPERTSLQNGTDKCPIGKRSLENDESATHILCDVRLQLT